MSYPSFSLVLLAGGNGSRMGNSIPKQYLLLNNKLLALYSFEVFLQMDEIEHCIVVCKQDYQPLFIECAKHYGRSVQFATPGLRRQDSVYNGIQKLEKNSLVCIHDSARPLITQDIIRSTVQAAKQWKAAVSGVRVKSTLKICDSEQIIQETPVRDNIWEVQTPQVIELDLLKKGFEFVHTHHLTVTDDVSLVEHLKHPVKVVESSYANIKVTTPEDLIVASQLLDPYASL